ncbi:MAG: amidohydrolase [bacterium]|nr:amidohydrolase [bacterium]
MSEVTVYTARRVITMNPSWPEGTAIAVRDGTILEVGTLESLRPWLDAHEHRIDERFAEAVILPGLIDPHLHPMMAAVILPMRFITALEWKLPWETVAPVQTPEAFDARLRELDAELSDPDEPLFVWGYHQLWHGEMNRKRIHEVSIQRPIVVWHRSFHELYMNDGMLERLGIDRAEIEGKHQIDAERGHFYENGLALAIERLNPILMAPQRIALGLERLKQVAHFGGHTTLGDMAAGLFDFNAEWLAATAIIERPETPFRVEMIPTGLRLLATHGSNEKALEFVETLPERNTHRLRFGRRIKLFTDGAFFSQLAQLKAPGYVDGHAGEWLTPPEQFESMARTYWNAGYTIHVHCTGDLGLELALDTLAKLQEERPRFDHGFTIEHFGFSTPEQVTRIAALGARVSANVYYLHELSDMYARSGIGLERASQMARLGSCVAAGVRVALHSDYTMAPALPLASAWVAATRRNCAGDVVAPNECLSVEEALRAITIDAAYMLGLEDEVGSLRAGKRADFAVVDADPFEVGADGLRNIRVLATVFEGTPYPVPTQS